MLSRQHNFYQQFLQLIDAALICASLWAGHAVRFYLLNRIDWLGDLSPKGVRESAGFMVNYLYRLDDIEKNHEAYANQGTVAASSAVKKMLKSEGRRLLDMRLS